MLTQQRLKELVSYDPETGEMYRLKALSRRNHVGDKLGNAQYGGRLRAVVDGKAYRIHRLAWLYMTGSFPEIGIEIDHINRIPSDNRWSNLRLATPSQNKANRKMYSNNTSGHRGISYDNRSGNRKRWRVYLNFYGPKIMKTYSTLEEAIEARDVAEQKWFGSFRPNDTYIKAS